jgi:hypothetical protein
MEPESADGVPKQRLRKPNLAIDEATGDLRRLRPMPVTQFHRRPKNVTFGSARPIEHEISNIEETTAYEDRPLVPPNARELYENVILSEFPDDPMPMPSDHIIELVFELAALKAKRDPKLHYTLHSSALLATAMVVNDYIKALLAPMVRAHVKKALDDEDAAIGEMSDSEDSEAERREEAEVDAELGATAGSDFDEAGEEYASDDSKGDDLISRHGARRQAVLNLLTTEGTVIHSGNVLEKESQNVRKAQQTQKNKEDQ